MSVTFYGRAKTAVIKIYSITVDASAAVSAVISVCLSTKFTTCFNISTQLSVLTVL